MKQVTLYTRLGCHLCELAKADLLWLQTEVSFVLLERDITDMAAPDQAQIYARFRYLIPVVDIAGGPLLHAPLSMWELRRALLQEQADS